MFDRFVIFWYGTVAWNWHYLSVSITDWWHS